MVKAGWGGAFPPSLAPEPLMSWVGTVSQAARHPYEWAFVQMLSPVS